ncbi:MAG: DUF6125 family protein [Pseudomonadota bacterium]
MDHPALRELEKLPKETLLEVIKMYSRNYVTVDGLWFSGVEEKYGLDAAMELDVRRWNVYFVPPVPVRMMHGVSGFFLFPRVGERSITSGDLDQKAPTHNRCKRVLAKDALNRARGLLC